MVTELILCILFSVFPLALMVGIIIIEVIKLSKKADHKSPVSRKVKKDYKRNAQVLSSKKNLHNKAAKIHFEYPYIMDYQLLKPRTEIVYKRPLWKVMQRVIINGDGNQRAGP